MNGNGNFSSCKTYWKYTEAYTDVFVIRATILCFFSFIYSELSILVHRYLYNFWDQFKEEK